MSDTPLPPNQQLVAPGKWPVVGEKSPRRSDEPWTVTVDGLVENRHVWSLDELRSLPQVEVTVDIHCVTRWSKPGARFSGVPLTYTLNLAGLLPQARFISFTARSDRGHSTSLALADAVELDVLLALSCD